MTAPSSVSTAWSPCSGRSTRRTTTSRCRNRTAATPKRTSANRHRSPPSPEPAANVDPVRMYLRQMASVALLTRDGEVEIARRIEGGEGEMIRGALGSPYALRRVLGLGDRLRAGEVRLRDLVRDETDEEGEPIEDDEAHRRRFLRQLASIRRLADECAVLADASQPQPGQPAHNGRRPRAREGRRLRLRRHQARLLSALCPLGLYRRPAQQNIARPQRG